MPTYSQKDFERIATALGVSAANVVQHKSELEAAARWYRLNIPPAKRQGGPTLELRKRTKKSKGPSGRREQRSKKPKTLYQLPRCRSSFFAAASICFALG